MDGVSPATWRANMNKWIARIEQRTGLKPIIYTGRFFWRDIGDPKLDLDLWIAEYVGRVVKPDLPDTWHDWKFWQYTDKGSIPGVSAPLALSLFNGTLSDLLAYAWGNSGGKDTTPGVKPTTTSPTDGGIPGPVIVKPQPQSPPPAPPKPPAPRIVHTLRF